MLFSIPETTQVSEDNGSKYWMFHIHVNGTLHCKVRYRQCAEFHDKLKHEFGSQVPSKYFPGKKLFGLTPDQLEERRHLLENFFQLLSQDGEILSSITFKNFFLAAQKATRKTIAEDVDLEIYLMNGNKFTISVFSTDETNEVLENAMAKIGISSQLFHYFALFLVKYEKNENNKGTVVRMLQDFESPYMSLNAAKGSHQIVIQKSYWSPKYDDDVMNDRIALGLLYSQVVHDVERGWIAVNENEKKRLHVLQKAGSKKEYINMARTLKYYGFIHFDQCISDFPKENSRAYFSIGDRELKMQVLTDENTSKEGKFLVSKIKSWKLFLTETEKDSSKPPKLQFAFEYLFSKDNLKVITIESDQAILISMCLQGIVDEIIREGEGKPIRMPNLRRKSDSSSSSSHSSSKSPTKHVSPSPIASELNDKASSEANSGTAPKSLTAKVQGLLGKSTAPPNKVFEDIGDDDL